MVSFILACTLCGDITRHLITVEVCVPIRLAREYILLQCPAYSEVRIRLLNLCLIVKIPVSHSIIVTHLLQGPTAIQMQLQLDSSVIPGVLV